LPSLFTDRRNGASLAPFDSFNLALHVGDSAELVAQNRKALAAITAPLQLMNQVHGDVITQFHISKVNQRVMPLLQPKRGSP
jgi:copper oxidase (laccase) domain-containing protein